MAIDPSLCSGSRGIGSRERQPAEAGSVEEPALCGAVARAHRDFLT